MAADTHFDVVVVGSGFGGSVACYRLADAGLRVCLLERGKSYPPGSFPRRPREMGQNFWDPSRGQHGLYNVWSFRKVEALVAAGLGGGSLIYANVLLRKDPRWFTQPKPGGGGHEDWPLTRDDLDPHYDQVEGMLGAQTYPLASPGYDDTAKTLALQRAAAGLGLEWALAPLAVTFANPDRPPAQGEPIVESGAYPNLHGRGRLTCLLCGECDIGCNYGSKNTLDHTYLSAAKHRGAELRARSEVRSLAPRAAGGYRVGYVEHRSEHEGHATDTGGLPERHVTCDRLVLGAGALGTPYLLLRNRRSFPGIGAPLGTRFCGNGDLLTFLLRSTDNVNGATVPRRIDASRGPVITSYVRVPDRVDGAHQGGPGGDGPGYYIQDAGFPGVVDWLLEGTTVPSTVNRLVRFAGRRAWARLTRCPKSDLSAEIGALLGDARLSSSSFPLLGMGRDVPDGVMGLRRKRYLDVRWSLATSRHYFERLDATMAAIADQLDADFRRNPLWKFNRVITVHPVGGAPMGRHAAEGVVSPEGEVFNHPGLFVADGSVMPGPVGPNPSLTIAAFANRMAERMIEDGPRRATRRPSRATTAAAGTGGATTAAETGGATALSFTEEMKGFVTVGELDYDRGAREGKRSGGALMFHLTIEVADIDAFVADPRKEGTAHGWVQGEAVGGRRPVEQGIFNLFVDAAEANRTNMLYRLFLHDGDGAPVTLVGFKDVKDDPGFDVWQDTTTLFTRLLEGHVQAAGDEAADVRASGVLIIHMLDFLEQLTTFRARGPDPARAMGAFGRLFLGKLWDIYAGRAVDAATSPSGPPAS